MTQFEKYMPASERLFEIAADYADEDIATIAGRVKHMEQTLSAAVLDVVALRVGTEATVKRLTEAADGELRSLGVEEKKDYIVQYASKTGYTREALADRIELDREHLADLPEETDAERLLGRLFAADPSTMSDDELVKTLDDMLANLPNPEGETDGQRSDI